MANKIKVKLILELHKAGMSRNTIADTRHMSRSSVSDVIHLSKEMSIRFDDVKDKDDVFCKNFFLKVASDFSIVLQLHFP